MVFVMEGSSSIEKAFALTHRKKKKKKKSVELAHFHSWSTDLATQKAILLFYDDIMWSIWK